jgi:translation initiation factor 2 alpha subunit (eIF-2alpha)
MLKQVNSKFDSTLTSLIASSILFEDINQKLAIKEVKVESNFELTCFSIHGIDAIKDSIKTGLEICKDAKIVLISSPKYNISIKTKDPDNARITIRNILSVIEQKIKSYGGDFKDLEKQD